MCNAKDKHFTPTTKEILKHPIHNTMEGLKRETNSEGKTKELAQNKSPAHFFEGSEKRKKRVNNEARYNGAGRDKIPNS